MSSIRPFERRPLASPPAAPDPVYSPPPCFRIAQRIGTNAPIFTPPMSHPEAFAALEKMKTQYGQTCNIRVVGSAFVAERMRDGGIVFVASFALISANAVTT